MKFIVVIGAILIGYSQHTLCWTHTFINQTPYTIDVTTLFNETRLGTTTIQAHEKDAINVGGYCPTSISVVAHKCLPGASMGRNQRGEYIAQCMPTYTTPIGSRNKCQHFDFTIELDSNDKIVIKEKGHIV